MKFLKENKGAIIFYLIIMISTLAIINDAEKDNITGNEKYVMVNLPN